MLRVLIIAVALIGLATAGCSNDNGDDNANTQDGSGSSSLSPASSGSSSAQTTPSDAAEKSVQAVVQSGVVVLSPENSRIDFVGFKPDGKHSGGFGKFSGKIEVGEDLSDSRISIEIETNSIWTDTGRLTTHLKSPDFFEVRTYPKSTFVSKSIQPSDEAGKYTITGEFTLHDVTKEISFPATMSLDGDGFTLRSEFTINRNDFGIDFGPGRILKDVTIKVAVGNLTPNELKTAQSGGRGGPGGGGRGFGGPGGRRRASPDAIFSRFDKNRDGKLTEDEIPEPMRSRIMRADADGDGTVTKAELEQARANQGGGRGGGKGRGPRQRPDSEDRPDGGDPQNRPNQ